MTTSFDLVVRNGTIVDGSGDTPFAGDVAVSGGRIAEVGRVVGNGREELDAAGLLVTPGFVDIHTHYDGQITWANSLLPSASHGVTTVLMGNCGVGFAPCRPEQRDLLMTLMEGIEDIPLPVMAAGLPWAWQSFPEYLDFLDGRPCDVDFATQVPHGAVRVFIMGQRAADREPATAQDIAEMTHVVQEALNAGSLGFSTSRTMNHRTRAGRLAPTVTAAEEELAAIAGGMAAIGKGVLQVVDDFHLATEDESVEFEMWRRIAERSGRPLSFTLAQSKAAPERWRHLLKFVERANDAGVNMRAQVSSRPVGSLFGLELSEHPFSRCPTYREFAALPLTERVAAMRTPAVRSRLLFEAPEAFANQPMRQAGARQVEEMYAFGNPPNYAPLPEARFGARCAGDRDSMWELAYDALLADDGHAMLYSPGANFAYRTLDPLLEMMQHPNTVIGLGDGGAHVARICDASLPTHILTYWTRDRQGERLPLRTAIRMLTHDTANAVGLGDRGRLAPGLKADLNLLDYDRLLLHAPEVRHDLPAGGTRLIQRADGYVATIVNGEVTYREGEATGALPGRLIRG
jgi:N-acyl-D-aspartate/D-glutamate deacylase